MSSNPDDSLPTEDEEQQEQLAEITASIIAMAQMDFEFRKNVSPREHVRGTAYMGGVCRFIGPNCFYLSSLY